VVRVSRIRAPGKDTCVRLRGKVAVAVAVAWRCSKLSSSSFAYSARLFVQYRCAGTTMSQREQTRAGMLVQRPVTHTAYERVARHREPWL
jgi:hypothetical protein